jgi:hypothetical protein
LIGPNSRRGPRDFSIVQSPGANKNQMWTRFRFAEELCAANRTKAATHLVAAMGDTLKIGKLPLDRDRIRWKTDIHGTAAGPEVLTQAAPTDSRHDRRGTHRVTDRTA